MKYFKKLPLTSYKSPPPKFSVGLGKVLASLGVFTLLGLLFYHRALTLGFLADDAWAFYFSRTNWLLPSSESPHYPPIHFALYYGLYQAFNLNPVPYHAFQLIMVFLTAALVKTLAENLGFTPWQCWTAGLLVLFNSVAAEAYFWFCIINTVTMTAAVVLGLICLLRFRHSRPWGWGVGYLAMVCLAASMDGKGLVLPLLGFLLDWTWEDRDSLRPQCLRGGFGIHFAAWGIIAGIILVRLVWGIMSQTINLPFLKKWQTLHTTLSSTFFHGLDNHLWGWLQGYPTLGPIIIPALGFLLLALLLWGWRYSQGQDRRRFFALVLLWIASCLPHTLMANLQFRYYYLPGVFAALVIVDLLGILRQRLAGRGGYLWVSMAVLAYLSMDLRGLHLALNSFHEASRIYDEGIKEIRQRVPVMPPGTHLVLVDFPTFIYSQQGARAPRPGNVPYVYVFPQALPYHLRLLYKEDDIAVTLVKLTSESPENPRPLGTAATLSQVRAMLAQPHTLAFRYLPGQVLNFVPFRGEETPPN